MGGEGKYREKRDDDDYDEHGRKETKTDSHHYPMIRFFLDDQGGREDCHFSGVVTPNDHSLALSSLFVVLEKVVVVL